MKLRLMFFAALVVASIGLVGSAGADSQGPITFESPAYNIGTIDNQQGWSKTGGYDVAVANVASFVAASGYGFGDQALRLSDSVVSGSFGDQTFSPGLTQPASESGPSHFTATFKIGTTSADVQSGLHMSVSPDDGTGGRMSYLRFETSRTAFTSSSLTPLTQALSPRSRRSTPPILQRSAGPPLIR